MDECYPPQVNTEEQTGPWSKVTMEVFMLAWSAGCGILPHTRCFDAVGRTNPMIEKHLIRFSISRNRIADPDVDLQEKGPSFLQTRAS